MRINCYRMALQIYIVYALLPVLHAAPGVVQLTIIGTAYLLWVIGSVLSKNITGFALLLMSIVYSALIFFGEYTTTMFSVSFGLEKYMMLVLFFFPLIVFQGLEKDATFFLYKGKIFKMILVLCTITAVTTMIGIVRFDEPCRQLAKGTSDLTNYYQSLNIGGYGFIYALIFLILPLMIRYKETKKIRYLAILVLFVGCIVGASYATAFVLLIMLIGVYMILPSKKHLLIKIFVGLLVSTMAVFSNIWISLIKVVAELFGRIGINSLALRMDQLYRTFSMTTLVGDVAERFYLRNMSLDVFKDSPILGNLILSPKRQLGMHSELFDILGGTGTVGLFITIVLVFIISKHLRKNCVSRKIKNLYIAIGVCIAVLAWHNTIISSIEILLLVYSVSFCEFDLKKGRLMGNKYENSFYKRIL